MGRKYIKQIINENFIYPNDNVAEYDVEIVHDINNNCVSGTVSNFSATTVSSTGITFSLNYTWLLNNAEPWIRNTNLLAFWSLHCIVPGQSYYKPWRLIQSRSNSNISLISNSETGVTTTITPSQMGVSAFTNGTYYFELRFIGHRCIFPVCLDLTISSIPLPPTATPVPTATAGPATPTPTPTPTGLACTSGATINVTDTGWLKYTDCEGFDVYVQYTTTGSKTITDCLQCTTIRDGIPFADLAVFTVTNCGNPCNAITPTPTPTLTGPTPTPTATADASYYYYSIYKYACNLPSGPCSLNQTGLVARSNTPLTNGWYYNSAGDGFVYQIQTEITPAPLTYDLDLSLAPGSSDCDAACSI